MPFQISFLAPWALLGLLVLPLAWWMARRSLAALPPVRRRLALVVRLAVLAALVLALAEPRVLRRTDELVVMFCLDRSMSIPGEDRQEALRWITRRVNEEEPEAGDRAGLVVFGGDAQIEISPTEPSELRVERIESLIDEEHTDIAQALRLATAAFPDGIARRIVLVSDGNQNQGLAVDEAGLSASAGVQVDVLPVEYEYDREVLVDRVIAPSEVDTGEPFVVRTVVDATEARTADLRVTMNGRLIFSEPVELEAGRNVIPVQRTLDVPDFYEIEATVETEGDSLRQNNVAHAFTDVRGESRVLYVVGSDDVAPAIPAALRREAILCDVRRVDQVLFTPARLQTYDLIVLDDVPASALSTQAMEWLEAVVRDLGVGLVMVGGPNSFGAGGYQGTPVERALPVEMELRERRVLPNGALTMILHTSEFPQGNMWAKEISMAAIRVLSSRDEAGIIYAGRNGQDQWLFPLAPIGEKTRLYNLIRECTPRDMQDFGPSMSQALQALSESETTQKHAIIISDGDPTPPPRSVVQSFRDEEISVSTIAINPHSVGGGQGTATLEAIASRTEGRFYHPRDPEQLPQIFIKEASVVRRSLIVEQPFRPAITYRSEVVRGLEEPLPPMEGYVATQPRQLAEVPVRAPPSPDGVRDPILATWRYGLGRTVAFTSDGGRRWNPEWVGWGGFDKFWAQVARWAARVGSEANLQVSSRLRGDELSFTIDAVDAGGGYQNLLDFEGRVTTPDAEGREVEVVQTGPGQYEGNVRATDAGTYLLSLRYEGPDGRTGVYSTGISVPYSAEYRSLEADTAHLERVARAGEGRVLEPGDPVFRHDLETEPVPRDAWPWLLLVAIGLLPLDVFLRRVLIDWAAVREKVVALLPRTRSGEETEEAMDRLKDVKDRVRETQPTAAEGFEPSGDPGEAGAAPAAIAGRDETTDERPTADEEETARPRERKHREERGEDAYTSRLLRAKRRALEDRSDGPDEDDEDGDDG